MFKQILVVGSSTAKSSFMKQFVPVANQDWIVVTRPVTRPDLTVLVLDDSLQHKEWVQQLKKNNLHNQSIGIIISKNFDINRPQKDLLLYNLIDPLGFGYDELSERFSGTCIDRVKARIAAAAVVNKRNQLLLE